MFVYSFFSLNYNMGVSRSNKNIKIVKLNHSKKENKKENKRENKKENKRESKKGTSMKKRTYSKKDFYSGDGMLTSIWGPNMWHYLHTLSFNYPVKPTQENKKKYKEFILNLQYTLPCKHCRINLTNNLKIHPLRNTDLKNRDSFSRYIYKLHEIVNKMLKKTSGLSYCDIRERYEHLGRVAPRKNRGFLNLIRRAKIVARKRGALNPYMVKRQNALLKLFLRMKSVKLCKLIRNV